MALIDVLLGTVAPIAMQSALGYWEGAEKRRMRDDDISREEKRRSDDIRREQDRYDAGIKREDTRYDRDIKREDLTTRRTRGDRTRQSIQSGVLPYGSITDEAIKEMADAGYFRLDDPEWDTQEERAAKINQWLYDAAYRASAGQHPNVRRSTLESMKFGDFIKGVPVYGPEQVIRLPGNASKPPESFVGKLIGEPVAVPVQLGPPMPGRLRPDAVPIHTSRLAKIDASLAPYTVQRVQPQIGETINPKLTVGYTEFDFGKGRKEYVTTAEAAKLAEERNIRDQAEALRKRERTEDLIRQAKEHEEAVRTNRVREAQGWAQIRQNNSEAILRLQIQRQETSSARERLELLKAFADEKKRPVLVAFDNLLKRRQEGELKLTGLREKRALAAARPDIVALDASASATVLKPWDDQIATVEGTINKTDELIDTMGKNPIIKTEYGIITGTASGSAGGAKDSLVEALRVAGIVGAAEKQPPPPPPPAPVPQSQRTISVPVRNTVASGNPIVVRSVEITPEDRKLLVSLGIPLSSTIHYLPLTVYDRLVQSRNVRKPTKDPYSIR